MTPAASALAGFSVGLTAARRREELGALLERRGARVIHAPAIRLVPLQDDRELRLATEACLDAPPDVTVVTTGIGFRGWLEAAHGWGLGDHLCERLARSTLLARGPKARGAIRAAGLSEAWSPVSESMSEVLSHLLGGDLTGARVAVQLHGEPLPDFIEALEVAGAEVLAVPVYRWEPPVDRAPLKRMVELVSSGSIDAVTFTSAPAAASLLQCAVDEGCSDALLATLGHQVLAACVGPVTAAPLERRGVPCVQPERPRLGSLARLIVDQLPARRSRRLRVRGHALEVRGHAVVIDGDVVPLPPVPMSVLVALAEQPGRVRSRQDLLGRLPGEGTDEHAVEMAVTRLRAALGDPRIVQTIVKRGYRLAYDPESVDKARPVRPVRAS